MSGRDIGTLNAIGAALIGVLLCLAGLGVALIGGCTPLPEPVEPAPPGPDPAPPDPPPDPGPSPAATACERACARADELGGCDGAGGPQCPEACERHERLGGAFARNPECQAKASTCAQLDACRSGSP